jgi:hypothetical protein
MNELRSQSKHLRVAGKQPLGDPPFTGPKLFPFKTTTSILGRVIGTVSPRSLQPLRVLTCQRERATAMV